MHPLLSTHSRQIADLCRRYGVRRLAVFGSASRGLDFNENRSDVDFEVEFDPDSALPALDSFFGLKEELASLLGRPVDLVEAGAVRNPYVRASIERYRQAVYGA